MEPPYWKLTLATIIHTVLGTASAFCSTSINIPESAMRQFVAHSACDRLNVAQLTNSQLSWLWSAVVAVRPLGCVLSAIPMVFLAEKSGRRTMCMVWNNVILIIGCIMQIVCQPLLSLELLLLGRFISGIAFGLSTFLNIYLAECSPDFCRGLCTAAPNAGAILWFFIGNFVPGIFVFYKIEELWHLTYFIPLGVAVIHMCLTPFIPESPKYLYICEKKDEKTVESIEFYHGLEADVDVVLKEFLQELQQAQTEAYKPISLKQILRATHLRLPLFIVIIAHLVPAATGIDVISQYTVVVLNDFGTFLKGHLMVAIVLISLIQVPIATLAVPAIEKIGRRPIFLLSIFLGGAGMSFMMASELLMSYEFSNTLAICGMFLGTFAFSSGSMICVFLPGEICPQGSRSVVSAFGVAFNYIPTAVISVFFLEFHRAAGAYSYLPFVIIGILVFLFLYKHLPETMGCSVDQIVNQWIEKPKNFDLLTNDDE